MTRRRAWAAVLALVLGLLLGTGSRTFALLSDTDTVSGGAFSTGRLLAPGTPSVATTNLNGGRRFTWSAANVDTGTGGAATISRYQVLRFAAATGGTGVEVCSTTGATTCDAAGQALGSYYSVVATFQGWTSESGRGTLSLLPDTTKPTVTFTFPTNGYSAKKGDYDAQAKAKCGLRLTMACGTATDNVGVTGVTFLLQRRQGTSIVNYVYDCWDGAAWVASTGQCTTYYSATLVTTGTTRTWEVPGDSKKAYEDKSPATYTLNIVATDAAGNTSSGGLLGTTPQTITFTSTN